jgi:hypothetical protein
MYVASESYSQIVLLIAPMCRGYEWEECKLPGLFRAAAATSTAYAASRLTRTAWEREDKIMQHLIEIHLWLDTVLLSFSSA